MNDAFLLKIIWRLKTEPESLWVRLLLDKYGRMNQNGGAICMKQGDSRLWKELVKLEDVFAAHSSLNTVQTGQQYLSWKPNQNGSFTTASAYKMLTWPRQMQQSREWKIIWRLQVPERVRMFIWMTRLNCLPTKEVVSKWGADTSHCPICNLSVESQLHALHDCPRAKHMWMT